MFCWLSHLSNLTPPFLSILREACAPSGPNSQLSFSKPSWITGSNRNWDNCKPRTFWLFPLDQKPLRLCHHTGPLTIITLPPEQGVLPGEEAEEAQLSETLCFVRVCKWDATLAIVVYCYLHPNPLVPWQLGQIGCLEAWLATGWPRNRIRRPEDQIKSISI